jgi:plastocyanin
MRSGLRAASYLRLMAKCLPPLLGVVVIAGCGGKSGKSETSGKSATGGTPIKTITIRETEFKLTPSKVTLSKPGTYEFKAVNDGHLNHALEIEGNGVEAKSDQAFPGESRTLKVTITKSGEYEMYCPVDGHRNEGMNGSVKLGTSGGGGGTGGTTTSSSSTGY